MTLAEAKHQCRIAATLNYHNNELSRLISSSRQKAEEDTGVIACSGSFVLVLPGFVEDMIRLPYFNTTAVESVKYIDQDNAEKTLDPSVYTLDLNRVWPVLALNYGKQWPSTLSGAVNSVSITFTAGFLTQSSVDAFYADMVLVLVEANWKRRTDPEEAEKLMEVYRSMAGDYEVFYA